MRNLNQTLVSVLLPSRARRNVLNLGPVILFVFLTSCYSAIAQVGPDAPRRGTPGVQISRQPNKPPDRAINRSVQKTAESRQARGLFVNKRADAMTVLVLKSQAGTLVPVDPSNEFKNGDQIKVQLESNFDGFIYVINIQPNGKRCLMFPYPEAVNNTVRAGERYDIPPGGHIMEFDEMKGIEILQVIMSRSRISYLDAVLKDPERCLAHTASRAAAQLQPGLVKKVTPVVPQTPRSRVRSRDIILAEGKDKDANGSVVAISSTGGSGKLKAGEIATFEIRLKHK